MNLSLNDLLQIEKAEKDRISIKTTYIDIVDNDLIAGLLLSEIVSIFISGFGITREGKTWIPKGREDWWDECRISPKQFDRASKILENKGIIEKKVMRFNEDPIMHIHLIKENLVEEINKYMNKGD